VNICLSDPTSFASTNFSQSEGAFVGGYPCDEGARIKCRKLGHFPIRQHRRAPFGQIDQDEDGERHKIDFLGFAVEQRCNRFPLRHQKRMGARDRFGYSRCARGERNQRHSVGSATEGCGGF